MAVRRLEMEIKTHQLYYGETLMPWGKGCVVKNPNGRVLPGGFDLIGVKHLALPDMLIEIAVTAVF